MNEKIKHEQTAKHCDLQSSDVGKKSPASPTNGDRGEHCLPQVSLTLPPSSESVLGTRDNVGSGQFLWRECDTNPDRGRAIWLTGEEWEIQHQRALKVIGEAKKLVAEWQPGKVGEDTEKKYERATWRLLKAGMTPLDASANRKSYGYNRSAVAWGSRSLIVESIDAAPSIEFLGNDAEWLRVIDLIERLKVLVRATPIKRGQRPVKGEGEWSQSGKKDKTILDISKRKTVKLLGRDDLDRWWRQFGYYSRFPEACAVLMLAGVRGVEFDDEHGVFVSCDQGGVRITVRGAKRGPDTQHGQAWRTMVFPLDTPEAEYLHAKAQTGEFRATAPSSHVLTQSLGRWSRKLWPGRKPLITPYSFRHAASARFKKYLTDEEVGKALGHSTDLTQQRYGMAQQWRGGRKGVPLEVDAASPVKAKAAKSRSRIPTLPTSTLSA